MQKSKFFKLYFIYLFYILGICLLLFSVLKNLVPKVLNKDVQVEKIEETKELINIIQSNNELINSAPSILSLIYRQTDVNQRDPIVANRIELQKDIKQQENAAQVAEKLTPINLDFSINIPKLAVNAPIVKNVSVVDELEYQNALWDGVAHAKGKSTPDEENGNIYLFAHSGTAFVSNGPYASVFNNLDGLDIGDTIYIFYEGEPYEFSVMTNTVQDANFIEPYELNYTDISVLTLQTCWPPNSLLQRRIVTAKKIL